jgi:hypothetical protein
VLRLVTNSTAGCVYPTTNTVSTPQLDQHDIEDRVCRLFVHASLPRSACSSIDKFAKCRIDAQDVDSFACPLVGCRIQLKRAPVAAPVSCFEQPNA